MLDVNAAERPARSMESAVRLTLFEVLADAAAEITSSLPAGHVQVNLTGRGVTFLVEVVPPPPPVDAMSVALLDAESEDDDLARITVRLPAGIKGSAEELATRRGQSLNAWIVGALRQAIASGGSPRDRMPSPSDRSRELSSQPLYDRHFPHGESGRGRLSGWL